MDIIDTQTDVLQMRLAGLTKIQIADRLGLSDESLESILKSIEKNKGAVKYRYRQRIMKMSLSELNKLKVNKFNLSAIVSRLEHLYCGFDNIPFDSTAYRHVLEFNAVIKTHRVVYHRKWDVKKAQRLLDMGVEKKVICQKLGISLTLLYQQIRDRKLDATKWNNLKEDSSGNYALYADYNLIATGSILDISSETNLSRELLRKSIDCYFDDPRTGETLLLEKTSYYERTKFNT